MIGTVEEAKKWWCPMSRLQIFDGQGPFASPHNRALFKRPDDSGDAVSNLPDCRCISSECAAWRWLPVGAIEPELKSDKGYCGAFGRPEAE